MISPETTNDILAEISHSLAKIADKIAPIYRPTIDEANPWHDQGNGTNHRVSQCSLDYCGQEPLPVTCTWIEPHDETERLLKSIENYRRGYSAGYNAAKNGLPMRDKDAACLFFGAKGIPDCQLDQG